MQFFSALEGGGNIKKLGPLMVFGYVILECRPVIELTSQNVVQYYFCGDSCGFHMKAPRGRRRQSDFLGLFGRITLKIGSSMILRCDSKVKIT